MNQTPEQKARDNIDKQLNLAGWAVQDKNKINFKASLGVAVREYQTEVGPADYVLFVDGKPVGVLEAKKEEAGQHLTVAEEQSGYYAKSKLKYINNDPLPFIYESTGVLTHFTDARDPKPRSRCLFSFHRPETFKERIKNDKSLRGRLGDIPALPTENLRDCQIRAINKLEVSFKDFKPRALIQMATGSGKTYTAITFIYRLLKFSNAKRVLFLVDTRNLGEQAEQEFMGYTPNDDNRKFTELYSVQRLKSSYVSPDNHVYISTIQRMYSILRGEELDESAEETNPNEMQFTGKSKEVGYNPKVPLEFFDFIVIDECHRSIYNLWRQVLEYFDAFLIGLTATPDQRTFAFFNENVVSEYTHEEAVADGVNVGFDIFTIETEITKQGSKLVAKEFVDKRNRLTRKKRWTQLDEDVEYSGRELDKDIVNPSQIRNIIRTFKDKLPEIFPGRKEIPKTLIFAKTDSHADDIIQMVREEFGEENDFCRKVTYKPEEGQDPKSILASFRNDYNPRIAVTVDMIATGTDVRPLECLLFMRDVRSKNYFEQMKGRGTRTFAKDDLKKVTPSAVTQKMGFVIVDAVGVTKSVKTNSRPLERKKTVPLKDLLNSVMMGADDEDTFLSLANRLVRLEKEITPEEGEKFQELSGGKSLNTVVHDLLNAHDPDKVEDVAQEKFNLKEEEEPTEEQTKEAQNNLIKEAAGTFNGDLNTFIEDVRRSHEQIIDVVNLDKVNIAGWDSQTKEKSQNTVTDFKAFIEEHKDEIIALKIIYSQPYKFKDLTYRRAKELLDVLKLKRPALAPANVWHAYQLIDNISSQSPQNELTTLVSVLRRVIGLDSKLTTYESVVKKNFQDWVFQKNAGHIQFTDEQMEWLRMIRDHIISSVHLERDDLDLSPFDSKGGIGRMYQLFGDEMDMVIEELNEALVA